MTPRPRLVWLFTAAVAICVAGIWSPSMEVLGVFANGVLLSVAVVDLLLTPSTRQIEVRREVREVLGVGTSNPVVLQAINRSAIPLVVELTDEPPEPCRTQDLPVRLELAPLKEKSATYRLEPGRRGRKSFEAIHLRFVSRLRLWTMIERRPLDNQVRIFPDIRALEKFELLAVRNRLDEIGVNLLRLRGRGGEFERLREYRREDEMHHVDWKATAKHERLISREFNVERNQNVVVLLDCGRSMANETDRVSHLDRGINTVTMLSYIALRQGDNMSLIAFSNRIERHVGPLRSKRAMQTIIRQLYDLEPRQEASDYGLAYEELMRRQRKRALILLLTHTLDEQHLDAIGSYLRNLTTPHVMACVFLRDKALARLATRVPNDDIEAFQTAAAAELLDTQTRKIAELRDAGVMVLEVLPHELTTAVINQYLDLKARHLL